MLGKAPPGGGGFPSFTTSAQNHQFNQILGNPSLKSVSSPLYSSSYGGPASNFFIPSSIPAQSQQRGGAMSPIQTYIQALQGGGY